MSRGVCRSATMSGEEKVSLRPGGSSATMASMLSGMSLRPGGGGGAMSLKPGGASALSSFAKGAGAGLKPKAPPVEAKPAKPEWERIKYTVPFLRKFQEHCKDLPKTLASSTIEIIIHQGGGSVDNRDWMDKKAVPGAPAAGGAGKGGKTDDNWSRSKSSVGHGGVSILNDGPTSKIAKAANPWVAGAQLDDDAKFIKKIKGILNKITPENFERLTMQLVDLGIDSQEKLRKLITEIFGKSVQEQGYCSTYADLCVTLSQKVQEFDVEGQKKPVTFKRVLLNTCQEEFVRASSKEGPPESYAGTEADWEKKMKSLFLGTMKLIGELGNKSMVPEKITHFCVQALLTDAESLDEDKVEALCMQLRTVGKTLEKSAKSKPLLDGYMSRVAILSRNQKLQSRIRFLLQQVVELRDNKWIPRREELKAKKISEVHQEAAAKLGVNIKGNALLAHGQAQSNSANDLPLFPTGPSGLMPPPPPVLDDDGWEMSGKAGREARKQRQQYEEAARLYQMQEANRGSQSSMANGGHSALVGGEPAAAAGAGAPGGAAKAGGDKPKETEEEKLARKAKNLFEEYLGVGDLKEALLCVEELDKKDHAMVVGMGLKLVLDTSKEDKRAALSKLLMRLAGVGGDAAVAKEAWLEGMGEAIIALPDAVMDAPNATKWFGPVLGEALANGVVEEVWLKEKVVALGDELFEDDVVVLSKATKAGAEAAGKAGIELGW